MKSKCYCSEELIENKSLKSGSWIRHGVFYRQSDSQFIQRWQCSRCFRTISQATHTPCFGQNKRRYNRLIERALCSGVTQRRTALILGLNRKTVVRKFLFLAAQRRIEHQVFLQQKIQSKESQILFDEMETHEVSKWKPLSIALAVNQERQILAVELAKMPARGREAKKALAKYGYRKDERKQGMAKLLQTLRPLTGHHTQLLSDEKTLYRPLVKSLLPQTEHLTFKGRRGSVVGQGELKKIGRDPLFSLNHTAAMLRANINRLIRRTWSVTQKPERLLDHLYLYMGFHNHVLLNN